MNTPRRGMLEIGSESRQWLGILLVCLLLAAPGVMAKRPHGRTPPAAPAWSGSMTLAVDLGLARQRIVRVQQGIPVSPGALTLYYPKWIPGENLPSGPIDNVAGLVITAAGQRLPWQRDPHDMYALHVEVPAGVSRLDLAFQYLSPSRARDLASYSPTLTPDWAVLEFNQLLFYPAGFDIRAIQVQPSVILPAGWQFASALPVDSRHGDRVNFRPVNLATLVDSPLQAGAHFKRYDLTPAGSVPVHLNIVADSADQLTVAAPRLDLLRAVVREAYALLGPPHYRHYDFMLTRSQVAGGFGLEHLESSDDRFMPDFLGADDTNLRTLRVLPHELVHSWNGKFRRPAGMLSANFNTAMDTGLQWVYEGLTDYWACMLSTRAGLWSESQYRDWLAEVTAWMAHQRGRQWRSLQDTATAAPRDQDASEGWANWRRSTDFYPEGALLWLDVDATIRKLSKNRRSLDDFARLFFAGDGADVRAYTFGDLVGLLNQVQPNDWASFLRQRLDRVGADLPEQGLAQAGWQLVYSPTPSAYAEAMRERGEDLGVRYALGMQVDSVGTVRDVLWHGPAFQAGVAPGMRIQSVNGAPWSATLLHDTLATSAALTGAAAGAGSATGAVAATAATATGSSAQAAGASVVKATVPAPASSATTVVVSGDPTQGEAHALTLQLVDAGRTVTATLNVHGGLRYPVLQRVAGQPDLLHDTITARTRIATTPAAASSATTPAAAH